MKDPRRLDEAFAVTGQLAPEDLAAVATAGFRTVVCNRPDGEGEDQPDSGAMRRAAEAAGLAFVYRPVSTRGFDDAQARRFAAAWPGLETPVLAYCRTGRRSAALWACAQAVGGTWSTQALVAALAGAGIEDEALGARLGRLEEEAGAGGDGPARRGSEDFATVVVVGGGAGGLAAAASLLARRPGLDVLVIEPSDTHRYQPGWTLVGGGVFPRERTLRPERAVMPRGARWLQARVEAFEPEHDAVVLEDGRRVHYRNLIVAPGLELYWDGIEGLTDTIGRNGVTSNYDIDCAPYTWKLVQQLRGGRAVFTQPPMPIKCAGAPQKAMYLSCDAWRRAGVLDSIEVAFHNAGGVLFGVPDYVPALERTVERYGIHVHLQERLVAVDGPRHEATFETSGGGRRTVGFDLLHAVPPQRAPGFVRHSALADGAGWLAADPATLRHPRFGNVFALGDVAGTGNAKTAAAVRKQAPVVAENVLRLLDGREPTAAYDGYGSCPLILERGRVVLAEFGYERRLLPTFPNWVLDGRRPSRAGWWLKAGFMPWIYFDLMLKGREWFAAPGRLDAPAGAPHRAGAP